MQGVKGNLGGGLFIEIRAQGSNRGVQVMQTFAKLHAQRTLAEAASTFEGVINKHIQGLL